MTTLGQLLISGIAAGCMYGLVAIEYTLIWNACGLLNFAHAKTITLGAYFFAGTCLSYMAQAYIPAIAVTVLCMALFGALIASIIFIPLRSYARFIAIMATVMMGNAINEAAVLIWGVTPLSSRDFMIGTVNIGGSVLSKSYIYIIVIALAVNVVLQLFMKETKMGRAMICVSQSKMAASLMGINVTHTMVFSVALSFGICGLLGCLAAPLYTVQQTMADVMGLKGFAAGVIGGFGSIPGAIIGGLLLGVVENISCMVFPSIYKDVTAFAALILVLLVKPEGLVRVHKERRVKHVKTPAEKQ